MTIYSLYNDGGELVIAQYYENPGHHDPKGKNQVQYNNTKSVIPENHVELWNKSFIVDDDPENKWAIEYRNNIPVYHRFQNDNNGNFHWDGSTDGQTLSGQSRAIKMNDIPKSLKDLGGVK
ncbi:hypothetical protein ACWA5Z_04205 [Testudinibacter sp. P80/BLE/0925]|uniref:hypothetical protein n=1 Tax=Testudinibacter sp. TW-1 TaxID=3417757 RepID=UPI003D367959